MLAAHIPTCGHRIHRAAFLAERVYADAAAAAADFTAIRDGRLLAVGRWARLGAGLRFTRHGPGGEACADGAPAVGDHLAIAPPGWPWPLWWVRVEAVEIGAARAAVRLRPSWDPTAPPEAHGVTAHFLAPEATMTLVLARHGATLVAEATGLDEVANTGPEAGSPLAAWVHGLVAEVASGLSDLPLPAAFRGGGLQARHWEAFVRNMLA